MHEKIYKTGNVFTTILKEEETLFLKKELHDKINSNNILFEIELYKNKIFQYNLKYSYMYYYFEVKNRENNKIQIDIFMKNNNRKLKTFIGNSNNIKIY